jgi:indole-3-glycerol phosphate synthase
MILDRIVADSIQRLEASKKRLPLDELKAQASRQSSPLDFTAALCRGGVQLIAEIKKASPSAGVLRPNFKPAEIARTYADNGAAAISVLTEPNYFQGSLDHLKEARNSIGDSLPLLRKDFIFDLYQVYEARAYGASCLLLIVAILNTERLQELLGLSHTLGMCCLVEVHNETEMETALSSESDIIGINNRDLNTFTVDLETTRYLRSFIPKDRVVVSESGIKSRDDMVRLKEWGVDAALVGEYLVAAPDIAVRMRELL